MRRNIILFVGALVIVSLLSFFLVFKPQTNKINTTRASADSSEIKAGELRLRLDHLRALQKDAPRLRQEATVLDAAVPNDPQLALFISQVQDQADTSGVDWVSVTFAIPVASAAKPGVFEVVIAMNVAGGYFQVQDYLVRLETLARALKIGGLTLSPDNATSTAASPDLNALLSMKMFLSPVLAPAPPTSTAT